MTSDCCSSPAGISSFNTASGMRTHVTTKQKRPSPLWTSFNTASGMRTHVTRGYRAALQGKAGFQYRKRYEDTCDSLRTRRRGVSWTFQYRKRYEDTCDKKIKDMYRKYFTFQYRKRYEDTCDKGMRSSPIFPTLFQYRKRYEDTCDKRKLGLMKLLIVSFNTASGMRTHVTRLEAACICGCHRVSIPQAV